MAARGSILYSFYSQLHLRTCSGVLDIQSHNIRRDDVKSYSAIQLFCILHISVLCIRVQYQSTGFYIKCANLCSIEVRNVEILWWSIGDRRICHQKMNLTTLTQPTVVVL